MQVHSLVGFSGVAADERPMAQRIGRLFEWPMLAIAVWICFDWYQLSRGVGNVAITLMGDWLVWGFFLLESAVLSSLVADRKRYLRGNWANILIIIAGFPPLWMLQPEYSGAFRLLRLLVLGGLLTHFGASVRTLLARNHLGTTLGIAVMVVIVAGIVMAAIDPAIKDPADGIWWAWVTFTTVGYGDIVPSTTIGRVFAGILMLLGVGLIAVITANLSAYLMAQDEQEMIHNELRILEKLERIEARLERLERGLNNDRRSA